MRSVLDIAGAPQPEAAEPTTREKILDAAATLIAAHGEEKMKMSDVGKSIGLTHGAVQHHFGTKKVLVDETNQHVLKQISAILEVPDTDDAEMLREAGNRLINIFVEQPHLMDYISRSLVDGGDVGKVMFRWFYELSDAQGETFAKKGMLPPGIDRVWAALNVVILRVGAFILEEHINEYLPEPFKTKEQIHRWEDSIFHLIRGGQLIEPPTPPDAPAA